MSEVVRYKPPRVLRNAKQSVNVGSDLRARLEHVARSEGYDATGLVRQVLREYVEAAQAGADEAS